MSTQTQSAYVAHGFIEPHAAEDHFAQQFDLSNPEHARDSYQRFVSSSFSRTIYNMYMPAVLTAKLDSYISTPSNSSKWPQHHHDDDQRMHPSSKWDHWPLQQVPVPSNRPHHETHATCTRMCDGNKGDFCFACWRALAFLLGHYIGTVHYGTRCIMVRNDVEWDHDTH